MNGIMAKKPTTLQLIRKAQRGDRLAFDQVAELYRPRLETLIRLRTGHSLGKKVDVEDVVQETFLKALDSIKTSRPLNEVSFFGWLAKIAQHVILNLARRHRQRRTAPLDHEVATADPSPSHAARRGERFERLQRALDSMSPEHREVILLARIEGLPLKEVGERMNRTAGATAQLLWRALAKLREHFGETESLSLPNWELDRRGPSDE